MIGQMAIFSRYHFEPSSAAYQKKIADFLVKNRGAYTLDKVGGGCCFPLCCLVTLSLSL